MAGNNSVNVLGLDRYVVDPTPGRGSFTTIQAAIDAVTAAGSGTIWINPGTYNENLTISSEMDIFGNCAADSQSVVITGNVTISDWTNSINLQNLIFSATTGDTITIPSTVSGSTQLALTYCTLEATAGNGLNITNSAAANLIVYLNSVSIQSSATCLVQSGATGAVMAEQCIFNSSAGSAIDLTGTLMEAFGCQIQGGAGNGIILEDGGASIYVIGGYLNTSNEAFNLVAGGGALCVACFVISGGSFIATGTGTFLYGDLSFAGSAVTVDPALTLFPLPVLAGTLLTTPPDSNTATSTFGTSLTAGTAVRNTLGYDILVNISVKVTAATGATLVLGVGPTATPTTDAVTDTFTSLVVLPPINFTAIVPNNYYLLVDDTGTITVSSITTQVCPL